jgi:hypothetical protein
MLLNEALIYQRRLLMLSAEELCVASRMVDCFDFISSVPIFSYVFYRVVLYPKEATKCQIMAVEKPEQSFCEPLGALSDLRRAWTAKSAER